MSSYYEPDTKEIGIGYCGWLGDELAWCKFINDVDHENNHWFLHRFIDIKASVAYDYIFENILNPHVHIGYKNDYTLPIVNTLFRLKRELLLVVRREKPYPHYELHYDREVKFMRIEGEKLVIDKKSEVEEV